MRQFAPNLLLFLLLMFLVLIYVLRGTTAVLTLGILLLAVAVFLAYTNRPRGMEILTGMTAFVSVLGMLVLGQELAGPNGGWCFVILWLIVLALLFGAVRRRAVLVERGQLLVINQLPTNRVLVWEEGLHRPLNPLFERKLAALPAYDLVLDTALDEINTRSFANVHHMRVLVRYGVEQPHEVVVNFPNREQAQVQLVRERGEPALDDTGEQVAFWTELIERQMTIEVDQVVRGLLAGIADLGKLVRARHDIEYQIGERLHRSVSRWGMAIDEVRLLEVALDPVYQQQMERETEAARTGDTIPHPVANKPQAEEQPQPTSPHTARLQDEDQPQQAPSAAPNAPTQAVPRPDATERVVQQVVERLRAQGTSPTPEDIERAVRQVLNEEQQSSRSAGPDDPLYGLSN